MSKKGIITLVIATVITAVILIAAVLIAAILGITHLYIYLDTNGRPAYYETQEISDYGIITGTHADETIKKQMEAFFPAAIEENFEDVTYVYHSNLIDDIGAEVYLEFTIEDEEAFNEHVEQLLQGHETNTFRFDESFQEYVLYDHFWAFPSDRGKSTTDEYWQIQHAMIAKVLINKEEHRLIYVLMNVYNGGAFGTDKFWCYIERFNINPAEYEEYTEALIEQDPEWLHGDFASITY